MNGNQDSVLFCALEFRFLLNLDYLGTMNGSFAYSATSPMYFKCLKKFRHEPMILVTDAGESFEVAVMCFIHTFVCSYTSNFDVGKNDIKTSTSLFI